MLRVFGPGYTLPAKTFSRVNPLQQLSAYEFNEPIQLVHILKCIQDRPEISKAHRLLYHSTQGSKVIKKKKRPEKALGLRSTNKSQASLVLSVCYSVFFRWRLEFRVEHIHCQPGLLPK